MSAIVLFCSSWFSYVFIVDRVYEQAWDTDCQLLVQKIYREELYSASDYADTYEKALREELSDKVVALYNNAKGLEEDGEAVQGTQKRDFEADRGKYTADDAASAEMDDAIDAMVTATKEDATANDREQAMNTLIVLSEQISKEITSLQEQISEAENAVDRAQQYINNLQIQLDNAQNNNENTEILENDLSYARQNYTSAVKNVGLLRETLKDYREANSEISSYQTYLGRVSETTELQISEALRVIQTYLLQRDLSDEELTDLETQAVDIFQKLLSSEDSMSDDTSSNNQTLLVDMESFIHAIQEYVAVCDIGDQLDSLILDLRNTGEFTENWKEEWKESLNKLKAQIGSLPTDEQLRSTFLSHYEKTDSMFQLDNAIRLYISEHNAADQAIIYMMSPYRGLAIFSLILAFFLDLAAFVTGLLIDVIEGREQEEVS